MHKEQLALKWFSTVSIRSNFVGICTLSACLRGWCPSLSIPAAAEADSQQKRINVGQCFKNAEILLYFFLFYIFTSYFSVMSLLFNPKVILYTKKAKKWANIWLQNFQAVYYLHQPPLL